MIKVDLSLVIPSKPQLFCILRGLIDTKNYNGWIAWYCNAWTQYDQHFSIAGLKFNWWRLVSCPSIEQMFVSLHLQQFQSNGKYFIRITLYHLWTNSESECKVKNIYFFTKTSNYFGFASHSWSKLQNLILRDMKNFSKK